MTVRAPSCVVVWHDARMPKLTDDELAAFLDEREHLARIGTVDDDGFPRVLPALVPP